MPMFRVSAPFLEGADTLNNELDASCLPPLF